MHHGFVTNFEGNGIKAARQSTGSTVLARASTTGESRQVQRFHRFSAQTPTKLQPAYEIIRVIVRNGRECGAMQAETRVENLARVDLCSTQQKHEEFHSFWIARQCRK
jgi:hypothetical protein